VKRILTQDTVYSSYLLLGICGKCRKRVADEINKWTRLFHLFALILPSSETADERIR